MDSKTTNDFRFHNIKHLNRDRVYYDYASKGILRKCLPSVIWGANPVLVSFLQLIDMELIMLFQYITRLKSFKKIEDY